MRTKVIQIAVSSHNMKPEKLFALCDDGSIWKASEDGGWDRVQLPPNCEPEEVQQRMAELKGIFS